MYLHLFTFVTFPAPAFKFIGESPGACDLFFTRRYRLMYEHCHLLFTPNNMLVIIWDFRITDNIKIPLEILVSGIIVDRWGTRNALAAFMAWWSVSNMLHALASTAMGLGVFGTRCGRCDVNKSWHPGSCFTQVIHRAPAEIADYIRKCFNSLPVLQWFRWHKLGSIYDPFGMFFVIFLVNCICVIIADHIKQRNMRRPVFPGAFPSERSTHIHMCFCHCPGRIIFSDLLGQIRGYSQTGSICRFHNLVSDAPHNDWGVIPVAEHHGLNIFLPPFFKVFRIIFHCNAFRSLRIKYHCHHSQFGFFPCIKCFIDYQHTKPVTGIKKEGWWGIMAAANRVKPCFSQKLYLAFLSPVDCCRAKRPIIVVETSSLKLDCFTV